MLILAADAGLILAIFPPVLDVEMLVLE